jgi:hypothetical protein
MMMFGLDSIDYDACCFHLGDSDVVLGPDSGVAACGSLFVKPNGSD